MGAIYKIRCEKCGYEKEFYLGAGKKDWKLERIYEHFDMMQGWELRVKEMEQTAKVLNFEFCIGKCCDCKEWVRVPRVTFFDGTEIVGRECNCDVKKEHDIQIFSEDDVIHCPECTEELKMLRVGLWD